MAWLPNRWSKHCAQFSKKKSPQNLYWLILTFSRAVLDLPFTLVFPIVPTILLMIFGTFFTVAAVYLESIRHKAEKEHDDGTNTKISFFHAINTVGMIWIYFFITGFGRMTLAGTFSTWFWTRNKHMVPSFMVVRFAGTTIRYVKVFQALTRCFKTLFNAGIIWELLLWDQWSSPYARLSVQCWRVFVKQPERVIAQLLKFARAASHVCFRPSNNLSDSLRKMLILCAQPMEPTSSPLQKMPLILSWETTLRWRLRRM